MLSRADVRRLGEANTSAYTVGEAMSAPPICVRPRAHIAEAAGVMLQHKVHRLPVVDDRSVPVGVATRQDVFEPLVATRDDVLDSCYGTTFWLLALGAGAREGAHFGQGILPAFVSDWTADLPLIAALHPPSSPALVATHAGVALGVAAAVTAARRALLGASPEFREATNRSNAQVLRPLRAGERVEARGRARGAVPPEGRTGGQNARGRGACGRGEEAETERRGKAGSEHCLSISRVLEQAETRTGPRRRRSSRTRFEGCL